MIFAPTTIFLTIILVTSTSAKTFTFKDTSLETVNESSSREMVIYEGSFFTYLNKIGRTIAPSVVDLIEDLGRTFWNVLNFVGTMITDWIDRFSMIQSNVDRQGQSGDATLFEVPIIGKKIKYKDMYKVEGFVYDSLAVYRKWQDRIHQN
jgi:hypothetical protein